MTGNKGEIYMGNLEENWPISKMGGGSYSANTGPTAVGI
jgi:hypothetical protein